MTSAIQSPPAGPGESEEARPMTVSRIARAVGLRLIGRLAVMSVLVNLLTLAAPLFVLQVYDRVIPHAGFETLKALVIGVFVLIVFDFLLRRARGHALQMAALRIDVEVSRRLFGKLTRLPLRALERRSDAEWRAVLRDADAVRDFLAGPTALLVIDLPFVLLFLAGVWFAAPPVALLLVCVLGPLFIGLAAASAALVGRATQSEQTASLDKHALTEEIVAGRGALKTLGLGEPLRDRWEAAQANAIGASVKRGALVDGFNQVGASLLMLTTVLMTTVGAVAIVNQEMTIGGLIAANMLAARVMQPLTQLIGLWRGVARYREAASRIDAVFAQPAGRFEAAVRRPRPEGRLALEKVEFAYAQGAAPTLRGLSLSLRPGAVTGLVGENGCGKSTLLKIAQGLYAPDAGRVLLDDADLAQFGPADLTRWFGYVPQEPFLFAGSVRDNIVGGRDGVTDDEILRVAELAMAAPFISALPDGFDAEVGEGGRRLPPGHRQRVALARALIGDPPVLVLDEPSANLDFQAETALCERLAPLKRGRSVLIVSHSTELLRACDEVLVMHDGRIAMAGRSEDVLARPRRAPPRPAPKRAVNGGGA